MNRLSHADAHALIDALDCPEAIREALLAYVAENAALDVCDNPTTSRVARGAERRSWEAVNRVATLSADLRELQEIACDQAGVIAKQGAEIDEHRFLLEELVRVVFAQPNPSS